MYFFSKEGSIFNPTPHVMPTVKVHKNSYLLFFCRWIQGFCTFTIDTCLQNILTASEKDLCHRCPGQNSSFIFLYKTILIKRLNANNFMNPQYHKINICIYFKHLGESAMNCFIWVKMYVAMVKLEFLSSLVTLQWSVTLDLRYCLPLKGNLQRLNLLSVHQVNGLINNKMNIPSNGLFTLILPVIIYLCIAQKWQ